jgi:zinc/manganese transport system permease protein
MVEIFSPFLEYLFLKRALIGCAALSFAAGPLGVFLLLRRMTLIGDALSHGLLPGVAMGFILFGPSLLAMTFGGVLSGLLLAAISALAARNVFLSEDAAFGGFYIFSMSMGIMLLSLYSQNVDLLEILFGSILSISKESLNFIVVCSFLTLGFLILFYRSLVLECFDPVFFQSVGGKKTLVKMAFLSFVTLTLIAAFQALGTFMALGLIILPALVMRLLTEQFHWMCWGASGLSFVASFLGLLFSYYCDWPAGPSIIIILGIFYSFSLFYSWLKNLRLSEKCCVWSWFMVLGAPYVLESKPLNVVVSFTVLQDFAEQVGGENVSVHSLVGPNMDVHHYHPTSLDMRLLNAADIIIVNGFDMEKWMNRLLENSTTSGKIVVVATNGIQPIYFDLQSHACPDPHAWQDVQLARVYVRNIKEAFCKKKPEKAWYFEKKALAYDRKLQALDVWIKNQMKSIEKKQRVALTSHKAFSYYARAYDLKFLSLCGLCADAERSAKSLAQLIDQIKKNNVRAIFLENMHNPSGLKSLCEETGLMLCGILYSDSLSLKSEGVGTYIEMMEVNTSVLLKGLTQK